MCRADKSFDPFAESTVDGIIAGAVKVKVIIQVKADKLWKKKIISLGKLFINFTQISYRERDQFNITWKTGLNILKFL